MAGASLESAGSSGTNAGMLVAMAAISAATVVLGGAAWYSGLRLRRRAGVWQGQIVDDEERQVAIQDDVSLPAGTELKHRFVLAFALRYVDEVLVRPSVGISLGG